MRNRDDFTCSNWVGPTHPVAAKHPSGIAKVLKKNASVSKTEIAGRATCAPAEPSCTLPAAEDSDVHARLLLVTSWERGRLQNAD